MYRDKTHVQNLGTLVLILAAAAVGVATVYNIFTIGRRTTGSMVGLPFGLLMFALVVVYVVFFMIWHYHNWDLLPERLRKTTPGRAVGFLFIPFYNFYWIFVSFIWLWDGLNQLGSETVGEEWEEMPRGIPIAYAILTLLSAIPFVGLGSFVLLILLITRTNNRVRILYPYVETGQVPDSPAPEGTGATPEITE
jgi:hypothetical protein